MDKRYGNDLEVRVLKDSGDMADVADLQVRVWGFSDKSAVPDHFLTAASSIGGLVLGAYDQGKLVGFTFSVPGLDELNRSYHYLHMIGVDPTVQGKNVGFQLMKRHYEITESAGLDSIKWTYDPLEGFNANLYIRKLGGVVESEYKPDCYGQKLTGRNASVPSDRFVVTLRINNETRDIIGGRSDKGQADLADIDANNVLTAVTKNTNGSAIIVPGNIRPSSNPRVYVRVPENQQEIKAKSLDDAMDWRMKTREVFTHYLSSGYVINNFIRITEGPMQGNYYQLEKRQ